MAEWAGIRESIDSSFAGWVSLTALDIIGLEREKDEEMEIEGKSWTFLSS